MSIGAQGHVIPLAIVLPIMVAFVLLAIPASAMRVRRALSLAGTLALMGIGMVLVSAAADGVHVVYRFGDWPVPMAIVLVLDRLSAVMVLLTGVVATASLLHAVGGADTRGPHFHVLFHVQLAGINGAFLTGDLFNLFVCFEILLIASYCLLVYGGTQRRIRSGVHYVSLNLVASTLFLIGVGTLYGLTGTLNLAHMAARMATLPMADAGLARSAALLLLVVFAVKAAVAPLYFWLPSAYSAASAPVAALFALLTKVGVYSILRLSTLVLSPESGIGAGTAEPWVLPAALVTVALGTIGAVSATELRRLQGYLLVASVGVMLAAMGTFTAGGIGSGMYYLVHSTLATAAMFLVADRINWERGEGGDRLTISTRVAATGTVGSLFFLGAVGLSGIPPLSGFVGKAWMLATAPAGATGQLLWWLVLGGSLGAMIALTRAGMALFWAGDEPAPRDRSSAPSLAPAAALIACLALLTVFAGAATDYTAAVADQLLHPGEYVRSVLQAPGGR
jgi:multicomponent K+:H+ antiporter subunit D